MRHKKAIKRLIEPDKIYDSVVVTRLINRVMKDGKKSTAEKVVYGAFALIKAKGQDPMEVFKKALDTVGPNVEIKARRVGGANYQVPIEVSAERKTALAIRWILEAAEGRANKEFHSFSEKLVAEFEAIIAGQGAAIQKRDNTHKQAEANRAFAHFRF